jgi:hypothetical protein
MNAGFSEQFCDIVWSEWMQPFERNINEEKPGIRAPGKTGRKNHHK